VVGALHVEPGVQVGCECVAVPVEHRPVDVEQPPEVGYLARQAEVGALLARADGGLRVALGYVGVPEQVVFDEGRAWAVDEEQSCLWWCGYREGLEEVGEGVVGELAEVGVGGVCRVFGTASDVRRGA
jgi:hypothetical protein